MIRRTPRSTRTDTLFPYTTLFRSQHGLDAVVINASGCGTTVKDYGFMLRSEPEWAEKAAAVSALAKDITEVMRDLGMKPSGQAKSRSAEHTSELQSLMRISYAVFCLKKKNSKNLTESHI